MLSKFRLICSRSFTVFLTLVISGCISATKIVSSDPDATVTSLEMGTSEVGSLIYKDRKMFFSGTEIKVEKSGCRSAFYEIKKYDEFSVEGFLIGLYSFGAGWFWITTYLPEYKLDYKCIKVSANEKK